MNNRFTGIQRRRRRRVGATGRSVGPSASVGPCPCSCSVGEIEAYHVSASTRITTKYVDHFEILSRRGLRQGGKPRYPLPSTPSLPHCLYHLYPSPPPLSVTNSHRRINMARGLGHRSDPFFHCNFFFQIASLNPSLSKKCNLFTILS